MQKSSMFARAIAMFAALAAVARNNFTSEQSQLVAQGYRSRGKGEGCIGNKRAKSSFKQNKRRGL